MFTPEQDRLFEYLVETADRAGLPIYVVGGAIRDLFLGSNPGDRDIDFLIGGNAIKFAELCQPGLGGTLKKFEDFYTAKIISPNGYSTIDEVDLASSRTEIYSRPGALPTVSLAPIELDLKRRDFTINAMAVPLDKLLQWGRRSFGDFSALSSIALDYFSGIQDLKDKTIRIIHDKSFDDDPTRIFRGVRYAIRLQGSFDPDTERSARLAIKNGALNSISKSRSLNELKKMAAEKNFSEMLRQLERLGVMEHLKLYPSIEIERVVKNINSLERQFPDLHNKTHFQVVLRIFAAASLSNGSQDEFKAQYLAYGFGAKEINRLVNETTLSQGSDGNLLEKIDRVSDAGIIYQTISESQLNHDILKGELHRRGLLSDGV